eukprot:6173257-Pleurochrysis_carterae.AAC.2
MICRDAEQTHSDRGDFTDDMRSSGCSSHAALSAPARAAAVTRATGALCARTAQRLRVCRVRPCLQSRGSQARRARCPQQRRRSPRCASASLRAGMHGRHADEPQGIARR